MQIGREEVKLPLSADYITPLCGEPKLSTKESLELINAFIKVARYKINIQKSIRFLYTDNKIC